MPSAVPHAPRLLAGRVFVSYDPEARFWKFDMSDWEAFKIEGLKMMDGDATTSNASYFAWAKAHLINGLSTVGSPILMKLTSMVSKQLAATVK